MCRGDPHGGILARCVGNRIDQVILGKLRQQTADPTHGRWFLENPVGFARNFVHAYLAADRLGSVTGNTRHLHGHTVAHTEMSRNMADKNRMVGGCPVQIPPGGVAHLCHQGIVVAARLNPLSLRRLCRPRRQARNDVLDGLDGSDGRAVEINKVAGHQTRAWKVPVGVYETGQHSRSIQIYDLGSRPGEFANVLAGSDCGNMLTGNSDGFGEIAIVGTGKCDDVAVDENGVGVFRGRTRAAQDTQNERE